MERDVWASARGSDHPLALLEGRPLAAGELGAMLGPKNRVGAHYFQLVLREGEASVAPPLLLGLHHSGPYPSYNWIEVIKLKREALDDKDVERLFAYLAGLIPSGGHIMVEYESEDWSETRLSLDCGVPPAATPLGSMLSRVGCGVAFKDWHFAEGGSEGPRKLQGYKALNHEHRLSRAGEMAAELQAFLGTEISPACRQLWEAARGRAVELLSMLEVGEDGKGN